MMEREQVAKFDPSGYWKSMGIKGGPGSGNFGHAGRPGEVGGSAPGGGSGGRERESGFGERRIHESLKAEHGTSAGSLHKLAQYKEADHTTRMTAQKNGVDVKHHYNRGKASEAKAYIMVRKNARGKSTAEIHVVTKKGMEKHGKNILDHLAKQYSKAGFSVKKGSVKNPKI